MAQAWHGRFMMLAWGICVPLGIFIARYFKVTPRQDWPRELDNQFWWHSHLGFQIAATVAMVLGFAFIVADGIAAKPEVAHGWFGRAILTIVLLQLLSGLLRGSKGGPTDPRPDGSIYGDHYAMTPRRRVFEVFHKTVGYGLLLMSAGVILQGLWIVNAPRWMMIVPLAFWCALIFLAACLSKQKRVSTYEAIWGPKCNLPGNSETLDRLK